MATSKKTITKKTSVAKKAPVKRVSSVKAKSKAKTKATPKMRSFHVAPNVPGLTAFKITRQTVYWVFLVSFITFMQLWILALQMETALYLEAQSTALNEEL